MNQFKPGLDKRNGECERARGLSEVPSEQVTKAAGSSSKVSETPTAALLLPTSPKPNLVVAADRQGGVQKGDPRYLTRGTFEMRGILGNCVCERFVSENKRVDRQLGRRGCGREGLAVSPPVERRGLPALPSSLMPGKFFIVLLSFGVTAEAGVGILGGRSAYRSNPPPFPLG